MQFIPSINNGNAQKQHYNLIIVAKYAYQIQVPDAECPLSALSYPEHGFDTGEDSKPRKRTAVNLLRHRGNESTNTFELMKQRCRCKKSL